MGFERSRSQGNQRSGLKDREFPLTITLASLHVYPVKSCRGIDLAQSELTATGLQHDREWMIVTASGKFVTQREEPRLATIDTYLDDEGLQLALPGVGDLFVPFNKRGEAMTVTVWNDRCGAFDMGSEAAEQLEAFLGKPCRLVRFNPAARRPSNPQWTGSTEALNQFADGFPLLAISDASLKDLNTRLSAPLPMNRFRPNLVLSGLEAYGEDRLHEIASDSVRLRMVKPCTRCKITTTNQKTGVAEGTEPLSVLRGYRLSRELKGVMFGQNAIPIDGIGATLGIGQTFEPVWR